MSDPAAAVSLKARAGSECCFCTLGGGGWQPAHSSPLQAHGQLPDGLQMCGRHRAAGPHARTPPAEGARRTGTEPGSRQARKWRLRPVLVTLRPAQQPEIPCTLSVLPTPARGCSSSSPSAARVLSRLLEGTLNARCRRGLVSWTGALQGHRIVPPQETGRKNEMTST